MKEGYSICFNEWALDKRIKSELNLLLIISSLCAEKGYSWASNEYLAQLFEIDEVSVSRKIKKLEQLGYLTVDYKMRGSQVVSKNLRLTKMLTVRLQKNQRSVNKNVKDNNISNNNTNNNNTTNTTIYDFLEENFGRTLNPIEYEEISDWQDDELTRYAIKQAVLNGKYNVKYISRILDNYKIKNIKTVAQAQAEEEEFQKLKKSKMVRKRYGQSKEEADAILDKWLNEGDEEYDQK